MSICLSITPKSDNTRRKERQEADAVNVAVILCPFSGCLASPVGPKYPANLRRSFNEMRTLVVRWLLSTIMCAVFGSYNNHTKPWWITQHEPA